MRICFCAFTALACAGALFASVSAAMADPVLDRFHALDGNGDGQVSWEEFHAVSPNISRKGFDMMDSDGSGSLCESEWAGFMSNHGMEVPASMKSMTMPARDAVPPASPRAEEPAPDGHGEQEWFSALLDSIEHFMGEMLSTRWTPLILPEEGSAGRKAPRAKRERTGA